MNLSESFNYYRMYLLVRSSCRMCFRNYLRRLSSAAGGTENGCEIRNSIDINKRLLDWQKGVDIERLNDNELVIHRIHLSAVMNKQEVYNDPATGYTVFTMFCHLKRGFCCGKACRHCPYGHLNVQPETRARFRYNTAFYK